MTEYHQNPSNGQHKSFELELVYVANRLTDNPDSQDVWFKSSFPNPATPISCTCLKQLGTRLNFQSSIMREKQKKAQKVLSTYHPRIYVTRVEYYGVLYSRHPELKVPLMWESSLNEVLVTSGRHE